MMRGRSVDSTKPKDKQSTIDHIWKNNQKFMLPAIAVW